MVALVEHTTDRSVSVEVRWRRALERAIYAGLDPVELIGMPGSWAVPSSRNLNGLYVVSNGLNGAPAGSCTCPAGVAGYEVCQHRATVLAVLGLMPLPTHQRVAEIGRDRASVAPRVCGTCGGCGMVDNGIDRWVDCPAGCEFIACAV